MNLKIKPLFKMADVKSAFKKAVQDYEQRRIDFLIEVGDDFVNDTRERGAYQNHTYNLRSSIACEVLKNGKSIHKNYLQVGDGKQGVKDAKAFIQRLKAGHSKGLALIVVTAEYYAGYVESRGYNVMSGSSQLAQNKLEKYLKN